jgi:ferredoxin
MYKRYHLETSIARLPSTEIGKFTILRQDNCLNCGQCIKRCIYEVHRRDDGDRRKMAEPVSHRCKNCFACVQNCPQQALEMVRNEDYESLGNAYWTPQKILTIWNEAEEGRIPVYGAGYRGPFKGSGFDAIWTDMSEIVRPTRDGIHGREYIATAADLGRKLPVISDFERLDYPHLLEIPVPMLFDANPEGRTAKNIVRAVVQAAAQVKTLAYLGLDDYFDELESHLASIAFRFGLNQTPVMDSVPWPQATLIELVLPEEFSFSEVEAILRRLRGRNEKALLTLGVPDHYLSEELLDLIKSSAVDMLHLRADSRGRCRKEDLFISESIRKLHLSLIKRHVRDAVTLLGQGGMAAAEHVPKAIICGADVVILDVSLWVAAGCRVCDSCRMEACPAGITKLDPDLITRRIINLTCSWRDQLLEILSAMGLRDVRRLRGEVGRAMFYEDIERESFQFIFEQKPLFR